MAIIKVPNTDSLDIWRQKTNLLSIQQGDFARILVPFTTTITGAVTSVGVDLTGTGTLFLSELEVGTIVKDVDTGIERKIVEITDDFTAKTDVAFSPVLASASLATVDLVTAINSTFAGIKNIGRETLIRAIAMS